MFKKILSLVAAFAFVAVIPFAAHAAVIGPITIDPSSLTSNGSANQSSTINFNGSCGSAGANGNVTFTLGGNAIGSSASTNGSGNFSSNVTVPSGFDTGSTNLNAICPNGDILSSGVTVSAPLGTNLNLNGANGSLGVSPVLGQPLNISGICGTTSAGSNVSVTLVRPAGNLSLGSTSTIGSNGNFSGSFNIPNNAGGGPVTIVATCPNGTVSINTALIDPVAGTSLSNPAPSIGSTFTVTGICGTTAGGNVSFTLSNATSQQIIGSATTSANGTFSTTLTVPSSFAQGAGLITAVCPTGNVVMSGVTINPGTTGGSVNLGSSASGNASGSASNRTNGAVSAAGTSSTPVGGVAAGSGTSMSLIIALALLAIGVAGLFVVKSTPTYSNDF